MQMTRRLLLAFAFWGSAAHAWGLCVETHKSLPAVTLDPLLDKQSGEIQYRQETRQLDYIPWSSASLSDKTFVVYHLAARHGIDTINDPFIKKLHTLPDGRYQLVVMLNIDDVFMGGAYFARKTFESNAQKSSDHVRFVLDASSIIRKHWCIREQSSTIMLVNAKNQVLRAKDGGLTPDEIQDYLQVIEQEPAP